MLHRPLRIGCAGMSQGVIGHNASPGKGLCETNKKFRGNIGLGDRLGSPIKGGMMSDRFAEIRRGYYSKDSDACLRGHWGRDVVGYLISEVERLRERDAIHWPHELDMAQREIIRLGGTVETDDGIALQA